VAIGDDHSVRISCGQGPSPPGHTVAWLGSVAVARWHPSGALDITSLHTSALAAAAATSPAPAPVHGMASDTERLAAISALCKGDHRLGGAVRVVRLGRGRLIRGQWRAEEHPLDPLASLADTIFHDMTPGPEDALVVGKARVYTMAGIGKTPFDAPEAATAPHPLSPESHMTSALAERAAAAHMAAGSPAAAIGSAAQVSALAEDADAAAAAPVPSDSSDDEDDKRVRRPSAR
jgi:hypothetical protein